MSVYGEDAEHGTGGEEAKEPEGAPETGTGGPEEEEEEATGESEEGEDWDYDPLPPPPPQEEKELLFLVEFLVDTLRLRPGALGRQKLDPCNLKGQNCVVLTFLHFPPMSICENDMGADKGVGSEKCKFNSGKSLVFALTERQFEEPPPVLLGVSAYKEMPHGFAFPRLQVGKTRIDLTELFRIVFDKYDEKPGELPVGKSIKDNYILAEDGEETADIDIYIRLTCLGQNVVTDFQTSEDVCNSFLFKNLESEKVYECREADRSSSDAKQKMNRISGNREPDPEDENYEEIFAEINGSALSVTVEKSARRAKPKMFHVDDFCDCDIPLPADLVEGVSDSGSGVTPASGQAKSPLPDGAVGKCDDTIVFQVPPGNKLVDSGMHYNVNTCTEGKKHGHVGKNIFKIVTNDDVFRPQMPNCPVRDVFQLRIIKKGRSRNGKGALDLMFKTPKEKIVPPPKPPYMIEKGVGPEKQKDKK